MHIGDMDAHTSPLAIAPCARPARWATTVHMLGSRVAADAAHTTRRSVTPKPGRKRRLGPGLKSVLDRAWTPNASIDLGALGARAAWATSARARSASAMRKGATLVSLKLCSAAITDQGAIAFGEALPHNGSLRVLGLAGNTIGDRGAVALVFGLQHNATLETVDLSSNRVREYMLQTLAAMLRPSERMARHRKRAGIRLFDGSLPPELRSRLDQAPFAVCTGTTAQTTEYSHHIQILATKGPVLSARPRTRRTQRPTSVRQTGAAAACASCAASTSCFSRSTAAEST